MTPTLDFALNHMVAPQLDLAALCRLARTLGLAGVEIRNDIAGQAILDGAPAGTVRATAEEAGVAILTINALQRFNDWTSEREREARALVQYARDCSAAALILVPVNDGTGRGDDERRTNVRVALMALKPMLDDAGIIGLVEPLGFQICSLRSKREAVEAIEDVQGGNVLRVTHDAFHHHLAGEPELFPEYTGLVHLSGVSNPEIAIRDMRDAHRVLVDARDRIGNVEQIAALTAAGYRGPFSFEPFSDELRSLSDPAAAISKSIEFVVRQLAAQAA